MTATRLRSCAAIGLVALAFGLLGRGARATARPPAAGEADLERRFATTVRPFVERHCAPCHSGEDPAAQFDISRYATLADVVGDHQRWEVVEERIATEEMPPAEMAPLFDVTLPGPEARRQVLDWIDAVRRTEARKNAGDPGVVLARRLSNAEYDYTIRDLTGVDVRPAREFPVDPVNPAGFDNSGESLSMSPALLAKYLQAAREVATHLVLRPEGLAFAPHPLLVETDRDKYGVNRILDFYRRQPTDLGPYFHAAWTFKHRAALGRPRATLAETAAAHRVSARYLATLWPALEGPPEDVGPLAEVQERWRRLPPPDAEGRRRVRAACDALRDFVVAERKKTPYLHADLEVPGIKRTAQPFLMWRNRQYAAHRTTCPGPAARFCAVFPDAFYVSERGRYFPDATRDKGRHLSAGFHNLMGYFRDDQPLYDLVLDDTSRRELDALWQELEVVAAATERTFVQFYLNESGEARPQDADGEVARPSDAEITSEPMIRRVAEGYLAKARKSGNPIAIQAVEQHFEATAAAIRAAEQTRVAAEPRHLASLVELAARAYRRPLSASERTSLLAFYRSLREEAGLGHEEALRDTLVSVLMAPDFCYRIDLVAKGPGVQPLSSFALASRLSYFVWSSLPDAELLALAETGELRRPEVLVRQARRMLKDDRARALATEFGGHWLNFRRFEEHNAVDRERFPSFDAALRQAMFEEPVRFMMDVFQKDRSVLEFLYARHTFVNSALAAHYGMNDVQVPAGAWRRVDAADRHGRGGLLPMAVFLTQNAPGLRTSPVKRGYWVVKEVLGERIPPPPAVVPEIPRDEAKLDLPVRDALARHRQDKTCASCHARFDAYGLVFEGYGPVGERRTADLAGRPVDTSATFPGGGTASGLPGLLDHLRTRRQDDFVDNLCRKLLSYALGRSLILSDEPTIEAMRTELARDNYRFQTLVENVVTSRQFRTKRSGPELVARR